jgi:hypothetical protein
MKQKCRKAATSEMKSEGRELEQKGEGQAKGLSTPAFLRQKVSKLQKKIGYL